MFSIQILLYLFFIEKDFLSSNIYTADLESARYYFFWRISIYNGLCSREISMWRDIFDFFSRGQKYWDHVEISRDNEPLDTFT